MKLIAREQIEVSIILLLLKRMLPTFMCQPDQVSCQTSPGRLPAIAHYLASGSRQSLKAIEHSVL